MERQRPDTITRRGLLRLATIAATVGALDLVENGQNPDTGVASRLNTIARHPLTATVVAGYAVFQIHRLAEWGGVKQI